MTSVRLMFIAMFVVTSCGMATKFRQQKSDEDTGEFPRDCSRATIEESLACIPGMTFKEVPVPPPAVVGYRLFEIQFTQPANHRTPGSKQFQQKLMLWHKDVQAPMVLQTSGYSIYSTRRAEITKLFDANQIQVEHRFFLDSRPENADWQTLTVEQSARDFHRVAQAFHSIYKAKWVNTGASKGGMTSVYHRYFFPNDVDATVAYVAPSSHSLSDTRYNQFLDVVGEDDYSRCRTDLSEFQRTLLKRKAEVLPLVPGEFTMIGSKDLAYEYAASESFFTFWQYKKPQASCPKIPKPDAEPEVLAAFLDDVNPVDGSYGDATLVEFGPYFYQAAAELGAAEARLANISDLVSYPSKDFGLEPVVPHRKMPSYDGALVQRIEEWAKTEASTMMFVYGGFDSWYAAAFPTPSATRDSFTFVENGGNHGAVIGSLSASDAKTAKSILNRWLNPNPNAIAFDASANTLREVGASTRGKTGAMHEPTTEEEQFRRRR